MSEPGGLSPPDAAEIARYLYKGEEELPPPTPEGLAAVYPYGRAGYSLGRYAGGLAARLDAERPTSASAHRHRYWTERDYESLDEAEGIEDRARSLRMSLAIPREERQPIADRVLGSLATLHEALPYSEAERRWLFATYTQLRNREDLQVPFVNSMNSTVFIRPPYKETLPHLKAAEGEIVSAGLRQVVQGRELVRRWWSWRRRTEEFEDEGSRDIARNAAIDLWKMLVPTAEDYARARVPWKYLPPSL